MSNQKTEQAPVKRNIKEGFGPQKELVMYYADSPELKIGADKIRPEVRNRATGQVEFSSHIIQFYGHIFKTDNPAEQKIIEDTIEFEQEKIKRTTQAEYNIYLARFNDVSKMPASDAAKIYEKQAEENEQRMPTPGGG